MCLIVACSTGMSQVAYLWPIMALGLVMPSALRLMMPLVLCWMTAAMAWIGMGLSLSRALAM